MPQAASCMNRKHEEREDLTIQATPAAVSTLQSGHRFFADAGDSASVSDVPGQSVSICRCVSVVRPGGLGAIASYDRFPPAYVQSSIFDRGRHGNREFRRTLSN